MQTISQRDKLKRNNKLMHLVEYFHQSLVKRVVLIKLINHLEVPVKTKRAEAMKSSHHINHREQRVQ